MAYIMGFQNNNQQEESIRATQKFLAHQGPPARDIIRIANTFAEHNMEPQAILAYQRAQQVEPENPEPSVALADYYFELGNEEQGIENLIKAFMIDPLYPGLAGELGKYDRRVEIPEPRDPFKPVKPRSPIQKEIDELEQ